MTDPLELEMIDILDGHGIHYTRPECDSNQTSNLDFHLTDLDLSIEVKAWSCERLHQQLRDSGKESTGIIVIIGIEGVRKFGQLLGRVK